MKSPENSRHIEQAGPDLVDSIAKRECVLLVGPGLSRQAGFPDGAALFAGELDKLRLSGTLDDALTAQLDASLTTGNLDPVIDELIAVSGREHVEAKVKRAASGVRPIKTHWLLAALPFSGVVTTNYDQALELAFRKRQSSESFITTDTDKLVRALQQNQFFIFHLHGSIRKPDSLVLTQNEYLDIVTKSVAVNQILQTIIARSTVLFVGFTLPAIQDLLTPLDRTAIGTGRSKYALVQQGSVDGIAARFLRRHYQIETLLYGSESELDTFLDSSRLTIKSVRPLRAPDETASLNRVRLHNVGPFTDAELSFSPSWNLLLGDNGTGKSVVLRAIAAALAGDSSDALSVGRLLRAGAEHGSIQVDVGVDRYSIELSRDAEGQVQVHASSLSPLLIGNRLVLAFPAVRGITWDRPAGPSPMSVTGPSPTDVVPIITGAPDYRINSLKQWIINLHYRASGSARDAKKAKTILEQVFRFWNSMTPELKIKFHGVERKTYEILVDTEAGAVPLESVSQGTIAVISWVGLLLQRLHDVYGSRKQPENRRALLLIDEIDAHMHPAWQQQLIPRFRRLFPNIQVIATTHSPLVTAELEPQSVIRLLRDGERIAFVKPRYNLQGLRADQVLTSPLFSLESTRNMETQQALARYRHLLGAGKLSDEETQELRSLSERFGSRMPSVAEREEARKAFELIEESLDSKLANMPENKKQEILEEAKALLQETFSEARKPS